jgi:uncharacterized protein
MTRCALHAIFAAIVLHAAPATAPARAGDDTDTDKAIARSTVTPKLEDTPKLTVRGEAELRKPADRVQLSVGVINEAKEAGPALEENNQKMHAVVKALTKLGLTDDEYETGRFRVRPVYSRRPRQADPEWKPEIVSYEVANSITIKTKKLDLVGTIIQKANEAGANSVEVTGFDLANSRTYRAEAIATATSNALDDARTLAKAASLKLVRITAINLDHEPVHTSEMRFTAPNARVMADSTAAPPIDPGDVEIHATVTIMYEIAPAP